MSDGTSLRCNRVTVRIRMNAKPVTRWIQVRPNEIRPAA